MAAVSRLLTAWAILLVLLAVPATTLAQSAGDDQYSDPLAGSEQPSSQGQGQPQSGSGQGSPAPQTSAPTQSAPSGSTQAGTEAGAASAGDALPRTGLNVVLLFAAAAPLLLGGFALHRVSRTV